MAECLQFEEGLKHRPVPDAMFVRPKQARMLLQRRPAQIAILALHEADRIVARLARCTSKPEFINVRKKVFSDYVNLSVIVANSFSISDDPSTRQAAVLEAFKYVEQLVETQGISRLGIDAVRESIFCIDTLRRAYRLLASLHTRLNDVSDEEKEADLKLSQEFNAAILWTQLHLDCLRLVVKEKDLNPPAEVLGEILRGIRFAVMAYAHAREGLKLRVKPEQLDMPVGIRLDEEDRELLEESLLEPDLEDAES